MDRPCLCCPREQPPHLHGWDRAKWLFQLSPPCLQDRSSRVGWAGPPHGWVSPSGELGASSPQTRIIRSEFPSVHRYSLEAEPCSGPFFSSSALWSLQSSLLCTSASAHIAVSMAGLHVTNICQPRLVFNCSWGSASEGKAWLNCMWSDCRTEQRSWCTQR